MVGEKKKEQEIKKDISVRECSGAQEWGHSWEISGSEEGQSNPKKGGK